jgi:hypothetical protein
MGDTKAITDSPAVHRRVNCKKFIPVAVFALLLLSILSSSTSLDKSMPDALGAADVDTTGNEGAFASDGDTSVSSSEGDAFCDVVDEIAGGSFASIFDGMVDCDRNRANTIITNGQFLVDYSFEKDSIRIREMTHLTITIKDKNTGKPVSDAFVKVIVEPSNYMRTGKVQLSM